MVVDVRQRSASVEAHLVARIHLLTIMVIVVDSMLVLQVLRDEFVFESWSGGREGRERCRDGVHDINR